MIRKIILSLFSAVLAFAQVTPGGSPFGSGGGSLSSLAYTSPYTGTVATTQQVYNQRSVSVFDYMTPAQQADVLARTETLDVTAALIACFANVPANVSIIFPNGTYKISGSTPIVRTVNGDIIGTQDTLIDARGFTGGGGGGSSAVLQISGSRGTSYVQTTQMTEGDRSATVNSTLASSLTTGSVVQITTDTATGGNGTLWFTGQVSFFQGEFAEVEFVVNNTVYFKNGLRDTYAASAATISKINYVQTTISNLHMLGSNGYQGLTGPWLASTVYATNALVLSNGNIYSCNSGGTSGATFPTVGSGTQSDGTLTWTFVAQYQLQAGLEINYGKDVFIQGGEFDGFQWAGIQVNRCMGWHIENIDVMNYWYPSAIGYYGYGIQINTCQSGSIIGVRCQSITGCACGGWEPNRDMMVSDCYFSSASDTNRCMGSHGNVDGLLVTNCTLDGSCSFEGKNTIVSNCKINARYPFVYDSDITNATSTGWPAGAGTSFTLLNCDFYEENFYTGSNEFIQFLIGGYMDRMTIRGNRFWGGAGITSPAFINVGTEPVGGVTQGTITEFEIDDNTAVTTNSGSMNFLIATSASLPFYMTNLRIRRNTVTMPAGPLIYISTNSSASYVDVLNNIFTESTSNASSIKLGNWTAAAPAPLQIRFNGNSLLNASNYYYPIALTAQQNVEAVGNTTQNFTSSNTWNIVAPNVLFRDNFKLGASAADYLGGRYYYASGPTYNVETFAAATPVSGLWAVGDKVWSTAVTSTTSPGWVCTTAGYGYKGAWTTSTSYTMGQYVYNGSNTYMATTSGTSGATAPTWTTNVPTTDGGVLWLYIAASTTAAVWTAMPVL